MSRKKGDVATEWERNEGGSVTLSDAPPAVGDPPPAKKSKRQRCVEQMDRRLQRVEKALKALGRLGNTALYEMYGTERARIIDRLSEAGNECVRKLEGDTKKRQPASVIEPETHQEN